MTWEKMNINWVDENQDMFIEYYSNIVLPFYKRTESFYYDFEPFTTCKVVKVFRDKYDRKICISFANSDNKLAGIYDVLSTKVTFYKPNVYDIKEFQNWLREYNINRLIYDI